jgi:hypothetical protein
MFTADVPPAAGSEKYDETVAAMIATLRYGSGVPFQRLERLEADLGIPLPAATQWELAERAAEGLRPTYDEFIPQAAPGAVVHNDAGMRILQTNIPFSTVEERPSKDHSARLRFDIRRLAERTPRTAARRTP